MNATTAKPQPTLPADYRKAIQGLIGQPLIDANAAKLAASTSSYAATGSLASEVIHLSVQVTISGGKTFRGSSWGISFPGGGALFGDVYSADLDALYANTTGFTVVATPVYTAVIFKDTNGNALGSFQAGAVSTVVCPVSSGSGSWK